MSNSLQVATAYQVSAGHRDLREQEADVFSRAVGALKAARGDSTLLRVRALADNRRLWEAVIDLVRDPANALPQTLRASIVSVGLAVQREMDQPQPDLDFLIAINESMAAGLSGRV